MQAGEDVPETVDNHAGSQAFVRITILAHHTLCLDPDQ